jgi:hypothetical protein
MAHGRRPAHPAQSTAYPGAWLGFAARLKPGAPFVLESNVGVYANDPDLALARRQSLR